MRARRRVFGVFDDRRQWLMGWLCGSSHWCHPRCRMEHFRNVDRKNNEYPHVDYPEIYLLKGGFKQFFADCPVRAAGR